jgi:hypothetical protein
VDYPHRWPSFFMDLIGILSPSAKAVDIYLRVLQSIDSEVVDRDIVHTEEVKHQHSNHCRIRGWGYSIVDRDIVHTGGITSNQFIVVSGAGVLVL